VESAGVTLSYPWRLSFLNFDMVHLCAFVSEFLYFSCSFEVSNKILIGTPYYFEYEFMNILFGTYPWAFDIPGGGERQMMAYRSHLSKYGVDVSLFDLWNPKLSSCDIFHFFSVMPGSFQLCDHIKKQGVPVVISPNLWVTPETKWLYPHDEIQRLVSMADMLIVNSELEASALSAVYGLPANRFHVVYNGVEETFFEYTASQAFVKNYGLDHRRYFLNVANVEHRKNQLSFLRALKNYPELCLVVVGHARDIEYLAECKAVGKDQFIFLGPLEYGSSMLKSAFAGADAFVMPSTLETPSIAALEAAAAGCKILVTSVGSTKEYFKDYAIYIDPDSPESMLNGLTQVLEANRTDSLRSIVREKFTWQAAACELSRAYERVLTNIR
jgi:glycosyltransferase involved in cell wall biosynthesis